MYYSFELSHYLNIPTIFDSKWKKKMIILYDC